MTRAPAASDRLAVLHAHVADGVPLTRVAAEAGVPIRTLRRWLAVYRARGPAGLARVPRADRGRRRLPAELVSAIEGWRCAGRLPGWPTSTARPARSLPRTAGRPPVTPPCGRSSEPSTRD